MATLKNFFLSQRENFFFTLTPKKTFYLFFSSSIIGCTVILIGFYSIIIASIIILIYGLILLYSQSHFLIEFPLQTKNSPYFMGFIFTLTALCKIFLSSQAPKLELGFFFRQAGVAILTTIFGLLMRQAIFSFDPSEIQEAELIRTLSGELKENAKKYAEAQIRLFKLTDEFIETRERLYAKDEEVSNRYIESLYKGINIFTNTQEKYTQNIERVIESIEKNLELFLGSYNDILKQTINNLSDSQNNYIGNLKIGEKSLEEMIEKFEDLKTKMGEFPEVLDSLYANVDRIDKSFEGASESIQKQTRKFDEELSYRLDQFEKELDSINNIMESFITLLRKYVKI